MNLCHRGGSHSVGAELFKQFRNRCAERGFNNLAGSVAGKRRYTVLQSFERVRHVVWQQVTARGQNLAELYEYRPQFFLSQAQAITTAEFWLWKHCLLYTSDAADDLLCVDLGGRRIIKK